VALARDALPDSDLLVFDYDTNIFSNVSPYAIANVVERQIHEAHTKHPYDEIVLVGHSMGGMLLRKAFLWGNGLEEDRWNLGQRGEREWVRRVSRFVSLATTNRGWSIDPRPNNMDFPTYISIWIGERLARLSTLRTPRQSRGLAGVSIERLVASLGRACGFLRGLRMACI
jgi:pimeloyl-ACP methyl ester carboxylesterase